MPSNPSSPATTVSGLNGGTTYGFIATAFDKSGNESAPSTEKQITLTATAPPPPSSTVSISNLTVASGKTYVVPTSGLQAGGTVYIDRNYTFTTVPSLVQGASYIRTANDDKAATNTAFLSFTVNQPVSVYVAHGDRITTKPSWLNTFTDTGTNLVTSDETFSLFVRSFPAGTITLGGNTSGGCCSMYSVVIKAEAGSGTSADTTPPTITLTAPSAGTVSGTVTVSASASDNTGVAGVQFRLQGANLGAEDTTNPYSTSWNTTTVPNGSYALTAIARDAAGNTTTSAPITVTVSNTSTPPASSALSISNLTVASGKTYVVPTSGLQAGGTVYIDRAYTFTTVPTSVQGAAYIRTANDDKAATNTAFLSFTVNQPVSVYVAHGDRITPKPVWLNTFTDTGTNLGTSDATFSLFVRSFPAGTIILGGNVSSGTAGNLLSMYSVLVKPDGSTPSDTTAPTVTLTAPSAGTVSGTVTVSASASDTVGVTGVQFRLQGANLGAEVTTNPYSTSWNTTTVQNGSYTLTAIARDAAGNTTTSPPRTITVSNSTTPPPPPPSSALSISNLTVASGNAYVVPTAGLQAGGTVYIDRTYTFTTIPTNVQGAAYIRTANDDKAATNTTFLSFTVNQPVSVYVAHDVRLTTKPSWLSTFTDTGTNLGTSDTIFRLFTRTFPAGTITLGGNAGNGGSMFSVIVKP